MRSFLYGLLFFLLTAALLLSACGSGQNGLAQGPGSAPLGVPGLETTVPASETAVALSDPAQDVPAPGPANVPVEAPSFETAYITPETSAARETDSRQTEALPVETLPPARAFADEDFNFYIAGSGENVEGKINVTFYPAQYGADGKPDPNIRVWDSCEITHPEEIRAICGRILASPFYDPDVYGRTLDSMVTEWQAHNDVHTAYPNERTRHVDLNRADEGLSYMDFWERAVREYLDSRKP